MTPRGEMAGRTARARRPWGGLALVLAIGVLAGCASPADAADGSGATAPALAAAASDRQTERMAPVQITDIVVPGPAAGRDPGVPNRLGSAAVPVRVYSPETEPWAELVWAHGGSFVRGTLDWPEADWVARSFAAAGVRVHSVDYVLASETVHAPAPGNDLAAVLAAVTAQSDLPVVIGGASAGGHLAVLAALAQADRAAAGDGRAAAALILEYPTLHRVQRADPAIAAATAELPAQRRFDADRIAAMYADYLGAADPADVVAADFAGAEAEAVVAGELPADRLALLPPTVIVNADADDLRASGEEFAEQLAIAGVRAVEYTQAGTVHGYLNRPEESEQARVDAADTIARFVAELRVILAADAAEPAQP